jgi:hypothetical protein
MTGTLSEGTEAMKNRVDTKRQITTRSSHLAPVRQFLILIAPTVFVVVETAGYRKP